MRTAGMNRSRLELKLTVCHTLGKEKGVPRMLCPLIFGKVLSVKS
jgi:hypothetical protein